MAIRICSPNSPDATRNSMPTASPDGIWPPHANSSRRRRDFSRLAFGPLVFARSNWLAIADEAPTFLGLPHSPLINPRLATVRSAQNETEIPFAIEIAT
jgi:hypothetical protein